MFPVRLLSLAGLGLLLGLSACITEPPPPAKPGRPATAVVVPPKRPEPSKHLRQAPPPPKPVAGPGLEVVGLSDLEVVARLGPPAAATTTAAAKVLLFRDAGCSVEVHFFPDVKQGDFRALETRLLSGTVTAPQCLERLQPHS